MHIERELTVCPSWAREDETSCAFPQRVRSFHKTQLFFAWFQRSTFHYSHFRLVANGPSLYLTEFSLYVYTKISILRSYLKSMMWYVYFKTVPRKLLTTKQTKTVGPAYFTDILCAKEMSFVVLELINNYSRVVKNPIQNCIGQC